MAGWLTSSVVKAALGASLSADIEEGEGEDPGPLDKAADAAQLYVERMRKDLFVPAEDEEDPDVFTPGADVIHGGALLAYRFYSRRNNPLGVLGFTDDGASGILRDDPDIARLLGIGVHGGGFVFGAPSLPVEDES